MLLASWPVWLVLIAILLWVFPDGQVAAGIDADVVPGERRHRLGRLSVHRGVHPGGSSVLDQATNSVISPLGFAVLPVCVSVAVLKYRLYAIDRIISRVISYTIITAVLAGVFAGLVILATGVLPVKTPVAVAASTLAAAALFNPLRRRVQRAVDRRFNRARYNAEAVVATFTGRLRQTVDLDAAREDLVSTVHQAFQPAHISVWLPPGISIEPLRHG